MTPRTETLSGNIETLRFCSIKIMRHNFEFVHCQWHQLTFLTLIWNVIPVIPIFLKLVRIHIVYFPYFPSCIMFVYLFAEVFLCNFHRCFYRLLLWQKQHYCRSEEMSRRNVLNSSRFYVRNLFRQREIENNLFCLRRYRISGILSNERENSNVNVKFEIARHYTQAKSANCWNCHKPMDIHTGGSKESFFCSSCGSLHDVNGNYVREWMHFE